MQSIKESIKIRSTKASDYSINEASTKLANEKNSSAEMMFISQSNNKTREAEWPSVNHTQEVTKEGMHLALTDDDRVSHLTPLIYRECAVRKWQIFKRGGLFPIIFQSLKLA